MTAATLCGEDSSLASQCLALCQTLVSQGKAFTFSLKIDSNSTLSFSLDTSFCCFARGSDKEEGEPLYKEEECPKED